MQHRIFLVAARGRPDDARRHWERRHGELFAKTPGLLGYTQNRPVAEEWERGTARFCSETWFADREAERRAYASSYYRDVVTPDEASFLDRESAWTAAVIDDPVDPQVSVIVAGGGARVLWFDDAPPPGVRWRSLKLARRVPTPGRGDYVHSALVDDVADALTLTRGAGGVAMVCVPTSYPVTSPRRSSR